MLFFTAGTILAPFAQDIFTLIIIRVFQGIAVASTPISTKIVRDTFPKSKFPIGLSIYLAAYSGGMALGAVLGPVVAAGGGWQDTRLRARFRELRRRGERGWWRSGPISV